MQPVYRTWPPAAHGSVLAIVCIFTISAACFAQNEGDATGAEAGPVMRRVAADVPMRIIGERIILPIKINDKIESQALLDTGAHNCVLDLSQMRLKKPKFKGKKTLLFPYIGKVQAENVVLSSLTLGKHRLQNYSVPAVKERLFWSCHAPFVLGQSLLRDKPFTLDFDKSRFVLWMPGSVLPEPGKDIERMKLDIIPSPRPEERRPSIPLGINGKPNVLFLVDTGAPDTFFFRALHPAAQGFAERRPLGRVPTFVGQSFQNLPVWLTVFRQIDLGEWRYQNQVGSLLDLSALRRHAIAGDLDTLSNLVGTRFLRTMKAAHFDLPNKALYFDRTKRE